MPALKRRFFPFPTKMNLPKIGPIAPLPAVGLVDAIRIPTGGDSLENHDRAMYQSQRVQTGLPIPPLPLTEAQAWAEAEAIIHQERTTHD